jgi:hypothetical protein
MPIPYGEDRHGSPQRWHTSVNSGWLLRCVGLARCSYVHWTACHHCTGATGRSAGCKTPCSSCSGLIRGDLTKQVPSVCSSAYGGMRRSRCKPNACALGPRPHSSRGIMDNPAVLLRAAGELLWVEVTTDTQLVTGARAVLIGIVKRFEVWMTQRNYLCKCFRVDECPQVQPADARENSAQKGHSPTCCELCCLEGKHASRSRLPLLGNRFSSQFSSYQHGCCRHPSVPLRNMPLVT